MEIRAINNIPRQNFGALIIDKGAEKILKDMPIGTLKRLEILGEEFKDYRHCDLRISKGGKFVVDTKYANAYSGVSIDRYRDSNEFICVTGIWESKKGPQKLGETVTDTFHFTSDTAKNLIAAFKNKKNDILDKSAALVRAFENKFEAEEQVTIASREIEKATSREVDYLMHKYGLHG